MEGYWRGYYRAHEKCNREYAKWQGYCRQQRSLLRELEDLDSSARKMYELDDSKDRVMTTLKLALTNLAMWIRDNYFPPEYARATWHRLAPFFRLPGHVTWGPDAVTVDVRCFNDRRLNRDLVGVRGLLTRSHPRLGRVCKVTTRGSWQQ